MLDVDWPDDTLELMARQLGPRWPLKQLEMPVMYPVTVPVLTDDVELFCLRCKAWRPVADWEEFARRAGVPASESATACPSCGAYPPVGHVFGEYERQGVGLFTAVLPVPRRHHPVAFDRERQAVNAVAACRMARRTARRAGLEPV